MKPRFTTRTLTLREYLLVHEIADGIADGDGPDIKLLTTLMLMRCVDDTDRDALMDLTLTEFDDLAETFRTSLDSAITLTNLAHQLGHDEHR